MPLYEYKVIPAPRKGRKARGVKGAEERFSNAIQQVMNDLGGEGWEFLRSETLPSEERAGLASSQTVFRSILVFRRPRGDDISAFQPELLEDRSDETHIPPAQADNADTPDEDAPALDQVRDEDWADETDADRTRS